MKPLLPLFVLLLAIPCTFALVQTIELQKDYTLLIFEVLPENRSVENVLSGVIDDVKSIIENALCNTFLATHHQLSYEPSYHDAIVFGIWFDVTPRRTVASWHFLLLSTHGR